jgi:hypothetical protein
MMRRSNWMLSLVALALCMPALPQATPETQSAYNIELVIFRATAALGVAEDWSSQEGDVNFGTSGESAAASGQVGRFVRSLPPAQFQLADIENKLRSSGSYVPVAHVAWSQTASAWGTRAGFPVQRLGVDVPGLTGTVFLERGQYLHLGMTLAYAPETVPSGLGAAPGTTFTLSESRRVRFYERNYYDHPAFGVIALVTPAQGGRPAGR